ncbi:MAG: HipA domain-containing protein [Acidiferrobacterales bacterium]|nr:HipA domain-containing protein [Acidiferrobacterales bacterium]
MIEEGPKKRQLNVFINKQLVGVLSERNGLWQFNYDQDWVHSTESCALTPALTLQKVSHLDTGSDRPVQWFFDNLLPEEGARTLIAKSTMVAKDDAFSLLAAVGSESAGAITLLKNDEVLPSGRVKPLSKLDISDRIKKLPGTPLNDQTSKRMSLAGAQHKMLIVMNEEQIYEPIGEMPSSHILKPEYSDPENYWFTVRNEFFTMSLAHLCDLRTPLVQIVYLPEPAYIIERFDRIGEYPNQDRLHVVDGCQLLNFAASSKYTMNSVKNLKRMIERCRKRALTTMQLFRWVLFNFLVGNNDAHLKNLSFSALPSGLSLMPHYDLLSTIIYHGEGKHLDAELSQPIGNAEIYRQVQRRDLIAFAQDLGLKENIANREIERMLKKIVPSARQLIKKVEALPSYQGKAGEMRMLRQIENMAIKELCEQIRL